jgi:hypothetical protein
VSLVPLQVTKAFTLGPVLLSLLASVVPLSLSLKLGLLTLALLLLQLLLGNAALLLLNSSLLETYLLP